MRPSGTRMNVVRKPRNFQLREASSCGSNRMEKLTGNFFKNASTRSLDSPALTDNTSNFPLVMGEEKSCASEICSIMARNTIAASGNGNRPIHGPDDAEFGDVIGVDLD